MRPEAEPASRLARRLGTGDAVVIGLGSMIGAGVFAAVGPAAEAAGSGLLLGLAIAAAVAFCNATSSAQLAAVLPSSGGTYVYGRARLGETWGHLAGWGFVVGKTASCAAMALTVGHYAWPGLSRPVAITAVVALTAATYGGIRKTARLTTAIVAFVLAVLVVTVAAAIGGGTASTERLLGPTSVGGVLEAGGLLFFAFAGYARIATLGEEVRDPARTIPRAIPLALGLTLVVYLAVTASALAAVGPTSLARSAAPLATAVGAGRFDEMAPLVRVGATVASLGVLLSLLAGVSRTVFAMAADGELPRGLGHVHREHRTPHRAELMVAALVVAVVAMADIREAIGFSAFVVLTYYAITNAAAWTLAPGQRRWPRSLAATGLAGCALLALSLPASSVVAGGAVLALGLVARLGRTWMSRLGGRRVGSS